MKNIFVLALALLLGLYSHAQTVYTGKVTDNSNNSLPGATIVAINTPTNGVMTDNEGNFSITLDTSKKVTISFIGYQSKTVSLRDTPTIIRLTRDDVALEEVVVSSASREIQKRSEVPGSIATITAQSIAETKALGIDQLVNQVPGVYMSTSRAASNEQHFMAVRSPISTKSLFLYLEDGLQIRPTSVFNHNALLEMNDISYGRIEVLKGPASSIYGSESIGGSFNFITKNPTEKLSGSIGFQTNDIGLSRYEGEVSDQVNDKLGFYLGGHFVKRKDGPISHSDYEKFATTLKTVYDASPTTKWTTVFDIIKYRSDMSGSLSEDDYTSGNYESDQTFTERDATAFRMRSTLDKFWNDRNKTSFNFIYRNNRMDQLPSYRVRQSRTDGVLTGTGSGEINSNQFSSYVGLIQHKLDFDFANSSLILGGTADYSPQEYVAETIDVIVDTATGQNIEYSINSGDYILNYEAGIFNYAGFIQYEVSPLEQLKITAALRYDSFEYDYDNMVEDIVDTEDSVDDYSNLTPKLGLNYNFDKNKGIYLNYSQGFTPPQVSTLYRSGDELQGIKPSQYHNYEIGGYYTIPAKLKLDVAVYLLDGKNTLITLRDEEDNFYSTNAGETQSYGIEYGITYIPIEGLSLTHNGSYAKHRYIDFYEDGIDYSDTDRETAPNLLGTTLITYRNTLQNGVGYSLTAEHELVGAYNTSFEGQVENEDGSTSTATYDGHSIFNLRATVNFKGFEIWGHALNILDELYAARASYNSYSSQNSYTIGNPRAFHLGLRYNF
ncbi:TonB-dependent receptor [Aquimarina pacifica]|uniref:TonB-dependent receptor n=1 Tax=Aquimarina pacifica TaxID=1296415 RepID=UPI00046FE5E3|nr:TonB-dependent receptor [Aquimarina pacifica]